MDFTSKASKRRERIYFYINSDKFLFLNDLYRLELASRSEPLSPKGKAGKFDIFLSFSENGDYLSLNQKIMVFYSLFFLIDVFWGLYYARFFLRYKSAVVLINGRNHFVPRDVQVSFRALGNLAVIFVVG